MMDVIAPGRLAVVTGAASGIGLAACQRFAAQGMRVCMIDQAAGVVEAAEAIAGAEGFVTDVGDRAAMERLAADITGRLGPVSLLMNNAAIHGGADALSGPDIWSRVIAINLMGVVHGVQSFVPAMVAGGQPGLVINTGSKQGITQPPGNTAYNVAKSAVKSLTEGLAHTLRKQSNDRVTAHLLIPGSTYTGMTRSPGKPAGAWMPDQVIDFMIEHLAAGDFYILCPDDETTRGLDEKRMAWAIGDIIHNRPALSRWHPGHKAAFDAFLATD